MTAVQMVQLVTVHVNFIVSILCIDILQISSHFLSLPIHTGSAPRYLEARRACAIFFDVCILQTFTNYGSRLF